MEAKGSNAQHEVGAGEQTDHQEASKAQRFGSFDNDDGLSAIDKQYAVQTGLPRRVHILGTGSIGKLVAHSLRGIANSPPITLIFHRYKLLQAWEDGKKEITIQDDGHDVPRSGFDVELMQEVRREHGVERKEGAPSAYDVSEGSGGQVRPHEAAKMLGQQQGEDAEPEQDVQQAPSFRRTQPGDYAVSHDPIHNLIVTTKAALTVPAMSAIRHRLTPTSTICFLQNGMGIIDDVNENLFPEPTERPNYMQGIITHGANVPPEKAEQDPFYAVHAGHGTIALGLLPRQGVQKSTIDSDSADAKDLQTEKWAPSSRYLLRTLTRSPVLCAVGFTPTELLQQQLEKLVVNSVLNPLTALLDNRNGSLLYNYALTRTMRLMLAETSHVIRSLPELQSVPNVQNRFSPERLETLCVSVTDKTKDNISSMLADVRAGRRTEIEYINGYIVKRGEEIGVKCLVNYAIMQTVIGKAMMTQREAEGEVPGTGRRGGNMNTD